MKRDRKHLFVVPLWRETFDAELFARAVVALAIQQKNRIPSDKKAARKAADSREVVHG